ncbi:MAG: DNA-directed DNA polymerase [Nitrososphaerota archaeon]
MRLWLLDLASEQDGGPVIALWMKAGDGSTWLVRVRYTPSFYLVGNLDGAAELLRAEGLRFERCSRRVRGKPVEALRVYVDREDLEDYAGRLLRRMPALEAYEDDVRITVKYLMDVGLRPCSWLEVDGLDVGAEDGVRVLECCEVREADEAPPPALKVVSMDMVVFGEKGSPRAERDPIRLITLCFDDGRIIQLEGDEAEIIRSFISTVREADPDIIVGFGSNRFQWSYLAERAKRIGVRMAVGRLGAEPRMSVHGHVSIRGRLNIDLEDMARDIPELTVETLEEFVRYLGIDARLDTIEEYELGDLWREDRRRVKNYSAQRSEAILRAFDAIREFIFSLSELTGMPADYVLTASAGFRVESYLMRLAPRAGELIPRRTEIAHVSYPGGLVKEPIRGMHEDVAVLDFRSMYPSLIIKYNISFDTLSDDGENIAPSGHRFRARPEGFLPMALKTLLEERRKIQERLKAAPHGSVEARILDARQRAIKIIANAVYGYTGWSGARWYSREVAEATTAWGRDVIASTMRKAEELGMKVIYSDTDSVFLKNYHGKLEKLVEWIEVELGLEAKLEKIFKRIIFTEAKKRYAGITADGGIEVAGLETIRGDWSGIAREAQYETVKALLETGDPAQALKKAREYVQALRNHQVDLRKLIIWKQITRPLSEYSATQPHIVVAKQLMSEGWRIQPGDKVGFIVTAGSGPLYSRAKPYFKVSRDEVDWEYYVEKQVVAACGRILEAVGISAEKILESSERTLIDFFG